MRVMYSNLISLSTGQLSVASDSVLKVLINNNIHDEETKSLARNILNSRHLTDNQGDSK